MSESEPKRQTAERLAHAVARAIGEVQEDVRNGVVPADVASFSALHDHVDANTYGGLCDDDEAFWNVDDVNALQYAVDAWIKGGGLR